MLYLFNVGYSQTDELNLDKYWKFRNDFVQKFVKIGLEQGESLPAGSLGPGDCHDNDGNGVANEYGKMHWGDGMIRHGFYLRLLATEYALRKKNDLDTDGVLHELYYALNAIVRLDESAEPDLDELYNIEGFYQPELNGFYLREDVGEDFCLNWETDQLNPRCTNSAYYENNNYAKVHNPAIWLITKPEIQHRNSPSLDQMTSLLVGLSLVNKLVDNVEVQPNPLIDPPFYIIDKTKAIVDSMVTFVADHNWEIIDVNGWPSANGGADLALNGYPILRAAQIINPGVVYNTDFKRRVDRYNPLFNNMQHCITGYGLDGGPELQFEACQVIWAPLYGALLGGATAGPYNNQNQSVYQTWNTSFTADDLNVYNSGIYWQDYNPLSQFFNLNHFNRSIAFNCGVMCGDWDSEQVRLGAAVSENYELQLTHAILNDYTPAYNGYPPLASKLLYKQMLDNMTSNGPYDLRVDSYDQEGELAAWSQSYQLNDWASTYRWVNPDEADGTNSQKGIYNALDYMVFHNLYYLIYGDDLPKYEESYECFCEPDVQVALPPNANAFQQEAITGVNKKLLHVPTCQPNVFEPVFNLVSADFDIHPKFHDYADLEISTAKFQTMDATITNGAKVDVFSKLIICNSKTLTVVDGELNAVKDDIRVKDGATIDLYGHVRIDGDNELWLKPGSKLIMHDGSSLTINNGGRIIIDEGADLEYYDGAEINSEGENAEFILKGTVKMMNGGIFEIDHSGSAISGRFILEGASPKIITEYLAQEFAEVHLYGKDRNDEFLIIREGSRLHVNHNVNTNVDKLIIHSCLVKLEEDAFIQSEKYFNTYNATYTSEAVNNGVSVSAFNKFSSCDFKNVPIIANLQFSESEKLLMISCNMVNEVDVNDAHEALVNVDGTGMSVNNCTFLGSNGILLKSKNMLFPSQISNSTFNQNTPLGQSVATFGLQDYSNTELKLISCIVDGMKVGAYKNGGDLTLRCNTFDNNRIYDVAGEFGSIVNASANDYGGYNYFNSSSTAANSSNIYVFYANVNVANGKNKFNSNAGQHIYGKLNYPCNVGSDCSIFAGNNQWNTGLQIPPQSKFNVTGDNNFPFQVAATLTQLIPPCGSDDPSGPMAESSGNSGTGQQQGQNNGNGSGPGSNSGNGNGNSPFSSNTNLPFIGTSFGSNIRLDHAVAHGREKMKPNNPNGDDEQAIDIFDEIFNVNIPKSSRQVKDWLNGSINDMKTSLENEIYEQRIAGQLGQSGIEFYINEYLDALNYMTDSIIVDSNYTETFYLELDKAHLYRVLGDPTSGLEILTKTETCGLDKEEQKILNYWKREYELDIKIDLLEMSYLDTVVVIDTGLYITPVVFNPTQFYFGTRFVTLNDREYSDCNLGARLIGVNEEIESQLGMSIYPNPADNRVNIQFDDYADYGKATILFYSSNGKLIDQIELNSETNLTGYSLQSWLPGIYFYEMIIGENKMARGKLIVK